MEEWHPLQVKVGRMFLIGLWVLASSASSCLRLDGPAKPAHVLVVHNRETRQVS